MFKRIYGDFKIKKASDYIIVPLKVLYVIYSWPYLFTALMLYIKSLGAIKLTLKGERKFTTHFFIIFLSTVVNIGVLGMITGQ